MIHEIVLAVSLNSTKCMPLPQSVKPVTLVDGSDSLPSGAIPVGAYAEVQLYSGYDCRGESKLFSGELGHGQIASLPFSGKLSYRLTSPMLPFQHIHIAITQEKK